MARPKSPDPVNQSFGFLLTKSEAEALDTLVARTRKRTGAPITRSSFVRELVVARVAAEEVAS